MGVDEGKLQVIGIGSNVEEVIMENCPIIIPILNR